MGNFHFTSTNTLWIALAIVFIATLIALARRVALPTTSRALLIIGMLLLAIAVSGLSYRGRGEPSVAVLIDRSPSTRGAAYYDRAKLKQRLEQLLVDHRYTNVEIRDASGVALENADAIVLFSDVQFDVPHVTHPTFIVVDPNLEQPSDGAVTRLSIDGDDVSIAIRNQSTDVPRRLQVDGVKPSASLPIGDTLGSGSFLFRANRDAKGETVVARIVGGDLWPENDELQLVAPATSQITRWWVSTDRAGPDSSWQTMRPDKLSEGPEAYLAPSVIVLDNVPANALSSLAQDRLAQYVRELGGALIFSGGERAFGAGGYFNSTLDALSPLSSAPPTPMRQWVLLVDSSGSMAADTKWDNALDAVRNAIRSLPPNDLLTVGSFARELRWWLVNYTPDRARDQTLPPADVAPNGPTNLEPALLQAIARAASMRTPTEMLILSDADAKIDDVNALATQLTMAKIRVNLLATGTELAPDNPVAQLVRATGGQLFRESDPAQWAARVVELLRAAMPELLRRESATVTFDESVGLSPADIVVWNRTWSRSETQPIARIGSEIVGARWNHGVGRVAALGFAASTQDIGTIASQVEAPPRDPRFSVRRDHAAQLHIVIDAIDNGTYLNGLSLQLVHRDDVFGAPRTILFTQTAPGRYELSMPAPRTSTLATIVLDDRVIDRFAVAGRYAPEFATIGNNRDAMHALAARTGGRVIEPDDTRPLEIKGSEHRIPLTSALAFLGAAMIAIGLIHWRRAS